MVNMGDVARLDFRVVDDVMRHMLEVLFRGYLVKVCHVGNAPQLEMEGAEQRAVLMKPRIGRHNHLHLGGSKASVPFGL